MSQKVTCPQSQPCDPEEPGFYSVYSLYHGQLQPWNTTAPFNHWPKPAHRFAASEAPTWIPLGPASCQEGPSQVQPRGESICSGVPLLGFKSQFCLLLPERPWVPSFPLCVSGTPTTKRVNSDNYLIGLEWSLCNTTQVSAWGAAWHMLTHSINVPSILLLNPQRALRGVQHLAENHGPLGRSKHSWSPTVRHLCLHGSLNQHYLSS